MEQKFELAKVVSDLDLAKDIKSFNDLLDTPPNENWVKKHPTIKKQGKPIDYLPTDATIRTFRAIFQTSKTEVLETKSLFNSIAVTIRVHYKHPITEEWLFVDGLGAAPCQTSKGKAPMDHMAILTDSVMKALPAAKSYAFKNAVKPLGRIFGSGLNEDEEYNIDFYADPLPDIEIETVKTELAKCKTKNSIDSLWKLYEQNYNIPQEAAKLFADRANEINKPADTPKSAPAKATNEGSTSSPSLEDEIKDKLRAVTTTEGLTALFNELGKEHNLKPYTKLFSDRKKEINGAGN